MTDISDLDGVWFVYDGDCPICKRAAEALRIKQSLGDLHLLDARQNERHLLIVDINRRQFDLDEGMVIYHDEAFYHGSSALRFMAVYGAPRGWFNHLNRLLFRTATITESLYPLMRSGRNMLLWLRGKKPIKNLKPHDTPIFRPIFGQAWSTMPPVMHAHYANHPFSKDVGIAKGMMTVQAGWLLRALAPISRLVGGIPAYNQESIPTEVRFESSLDDSCLTFHRIFSYEDRKPYVFRSKMVPLGGNLLVEKMKFGLCWRVRFAWTGESVQLRHAGYAISVFGSIIKVPLNWLLGSIEASEEAMGPSTFKMAVSISHPVWGIYYRYSGTFEMMASDDKANHG